MAAPPTFQRLTKSSIKHYGATVSDLRTELELAPKRAVRKRAKLLSKLGVLLLADSDTLNTAGAILNEAHRLALDVQNNTRLVATNKIRRAMAFQYRGHFAAALQAYDEVISFIKKYSVRRLEDFALQHKGKCLVETGEYEAAGQCLEAALRIRRRRGDAELVHSTMRAIKELERRSWRKSDSVIRSSGDSQNGARQARRRKATKTRRGSN